MMATRKRQPRQTWKEYLAQHPHLNELYRSRRLAEVDHEAETQELIDDMLDREDWQRGGW